MGMREHINGRLRGGLDALLPHLPDDAHRAFASQVFLPVGWYDVLPIQAMCVAIAAVEGLPFNESVRSRAVIVAHRDMSGMYKLLLRVATPDLVLDRLQRAALRYFDFGRVELLEARKGRSEARITGFPGMVTPWFAAMISGYAPEVLKAAGATSPRVRLDAPEPEGERLGVETVTLRLHLAWG
jgi:hypothetical protein